jgi:SHS2 domain-containing protein
MSNCTVEELGHTAEIGLRISAPTAPDVFACSAEAMFALLYPDQDEDQSEDTGISSRSVAVESIDVESLLVDWLNELLYLYETNGECYSRCTILRWSPTELVATVHGNKASQPPAMHIKAVTYHQLQVHSKGTGWQAQVFFDI